MKLLILGWLLGLLSPAITDAIRRARENGQSAKAIDSELKDLGYRLATASYAVRSNLGIHDRGALDAYLKVLKSDPTRDETANIVPAVELLLGMSDEQLSQSNKHLKLNQGAVPILQKFSAPLLDSRISAIWSFDNRYQQDLLSVRTHLSFLNDIVDRSRTCHDFTFAELSKENHELINQNYIFLCNDYAARCDIIAKIIYK